MGATNTGKLFQDIATRTNGDIYIGVVGPVRTGKSTFITRFMQNAIVPKIENKDERTRLIDELPQSGDGVTIMTTQPKFVPAKAVQIRVAEQNTMRVRMIDCVGYMVPGAEGHIINGKPRLVKTPWSDNEIPFEKAAEIGTKKVIKEHSTVAIVMTTDGTITGIDRRNYLASEERVISQLKKQSKPFVVVLNSKEPLAPATQKIITEITKKHDVTAIALDVEQLSTENINQIFTAILAEFGVNGFKVTMPRWLSVLDAEHPIIAEAVDTLKRHTASVKRLADNQTAHLFEKSTNFASLETTNVDVATGIISYNLVPREGLYNRLLGELGGVELSSEAHMVAFMRQLGGAKAGYDKLSSAMTQAVESGYGIVEPLFNEFTLSAPTLFKQGKSHGIKFRATAPSIHLVRIDLATEVSPVIGSKPQAEEMLKHLTAEFEADPHKLWQTPIFGKSLEFLVTEGMGQKAVSMPTTARVKMKRTITKIVNNGRGGVICILI